MLLPFHVLLQKPGPPPPVPAPFVPRPSKAVIYQIGPGYIMELEGTGAKIKAQNPQHLIRSAQKMGIPIEFLDYSYGYHVCLRFQRGVEL